MLGLGSFSQVRQAAARFIKWILLSLLMGAVGGLLGTAFHYTLLGVTALRGAQEWMLFLLPVGGLATVGLYRLCRLRMEDGANATVKAMREGHPISPLLAPAVFLSTAVAHLCGASAGREGAALQIGGSVASLLNKRLRLTDREQSLLVMCGMSAAFAGLFGTPLAACLFVPEISTTGAAFAAVLLPCFVAALTASGVSLLCGVHAHTAVQSQAMPLTLETGWRLVLLALAIVALGFLMCFLFRVAKRGAARLLPRPWLRIVAGGVMLIVLTLLVGNQRFNGAGMKMAMQAVEGNTNTFSFLLKLLFTAVTLAAGFKGGEIVPTFCIGATFGCMMGGLLGLEPGAAAALGLVGLFCCATKSPLASIVLSVEMFGGVNLWAFSLICLIAYTLSCHNGLFSVRPEFLHLPARRCKDAPQA